MILDNYFIKPLALLSLLIFSSCSIKESRKTVISGNTMGTTYSITILDFNHDTAEFKKNINERLDVINQIFSTYVNNSEISNINQSGTDLIELSSEFRYVLDKALHYCKISDGYYDITVGPLIDLWGFNNIYSKAPSNSEILDAMKNIGYNKIYMNNQFLVKKSKKVNIDLNSIAKGYGVDEVSNLIESKGYNNYLVEIGGELRSKMTHKGNDWVVGIQHPKSNSVIKKIKLNNLSMATSGTYNNFFELDNIIYSHILNPKTGYPYKHKTISSTVIADKCIDADAYATISMTMNPSDVLNLINNHNGVEVYIIELDENNGIIEYMSNGFENIVY